MHLSVSEAVRGSAKSAEGTGNTLLFLGGTFPILILRCSHVHLCLVLSLWFCASGRKK